MARDFSSQLSARLAGVPFFCGVPAASSRYLCLRNGPWISKEDIRMRKTCQDESSNGVAGMGVNSAGQLIKRSLGTAVASGDAAQVSFIMSSREHHGRSATEADFVSHDGAGCITAIGRPSSRRGARCCSSIAGTNIPGAGRQTVDALGLKMWTFSRGMRAGMALRRRAWLG